MDQWGRRFPAALSSAMIFFKALVHNDAVVTDAVDIQAAVFGEHVDLAFVQPVLVLAEQFGDVTDSEDG